MVGDPNQLKRVLDQLARRLDDDPDAATVALLALMTGHGVLVVAGPGAAREFATVLAVARKESKPFEVAVASDTSVDELFGPLSLQSLERDDAHVRLSQGFLPSAAVALVHEPFAAASGVRNALIRFYRDGPGDPQRPVLVGRTSTQYGEDALRAFFPLACRTLDHLALRSAIDGEHVGEVPVGEAHRSDVRVPASTASALYAVAGRLRDLDIRFDDSFWHAWLDILRSAAHAEGLDFVPWQLVLLLSHMAVPAAPETVDEVVRTAITSDVIREVEDVMRASQRLRQHLLEEVRGEAPRHNARGEPLYLDEDAVPTTVRYGPPAKFHAPRIAGLTGPQTREQLWTGYFATETKGKKLLALWVDDESNWAGPPLEREPLMGPAAYAAEHVQMRRAELAELRQVRDDLVEGLRRVREFDSVWVRPERMAPLRVVADDGLARLARLAALFDECAGLLSLIPIVGDDVPDD